MSEIIADEMGRLQERIDEVEEQRDSYSEALQAILSWSEAYPLDIFPEPDLAKARDLLKAGGITIDAVSAHVARHVIEGVGRIARKALEA